MDDFDDVKPIAILQPNEPARLITSGNYLNGRVTLTNIKNTSTNATLTFHELKCEDERDYVYVTTMTWTVLPCRQKSLHQPVYQYKKTSPQEQKPITYSNETTYKEEIPGQCSFKGTSHLTVKIDAEDIKAKIRCFEESQVNVTGMYLETELFDVQFQVNHVNISKQPDQKQYGQKSDKITLTCKGNGNPEPQYEWFKKENNNSILSKRSFYVIENIIQNNSGVKSNSVEIDIVHVDEMPSSQDSSLMPIFIGSYVTDNDVDCGFSF
ncbi:ALCAM [Mytilus coruscus]|uniref:ALCAM n=1 Tax=Mytilus coruscus TaxID=42192 RepID=A0A6J8BYD6_MYTCO|nr:ALCAM [Mytilus coruscus]